jgi:hypothetical protein
MFRGSVDEEVGCSLELWSRAEQDEPFRAVRVVLSLPVGGPMRAIAVRDRHEVAKPTVSKHIGGGIEIEGSLFEPVPYEADAALTVA